jgi:hypothetical protein
LCDTVIGHWEESLGLGSCGYDASRHRQLLQVDGRGGTGKSCTLKVVSAAIQCLSIAHGLHHSVLKRLLLQGLLPTPLEVKLVTICRAFLLLQLVTFGNSPLLRLQIIIRNRLQHREYLILDETLIVGVRLYNYIDRRMRQIFEKDLSFDRRNIMLLGDHQLPPVLQNPLFRDVDNLCDSQDNAGRIAYEQFTKTM